MEITQNLKKQAIFYTDSELEETIAYICRKQILRGFPEKDIISVSLKPLKFGQNITFKEKRGYLTMSRQILTALESCTADYIWFLEHDVLYHPSHFDFNPPRDDIFYYNLNFWKVRASDGHALRTKDARTLSQMCASRKLLIPHYQKRVKLLEDFFKNHPDPHEQNKYVRAMGFEPGTHHRPEAVDNTESDVWNSLTPNIDIRLDTCLTPSRWRKDQYRNPKFTEGWQESDRIPGWDVTEGRFNEFLVELI
jgi:hypothetical protein